MLDVVGLLVIVYYCVTSVKTKDTCSSSTIRCSSTYRRSLELKNCPYINNNVFLSSMLEGI